MKGGHPTKGSTEIARREAEFLLYAALDGAVKVRVLFKDETAWLTQKGLAELFGVKVPAVTKHLKNIFDSAELSRAATVSKMEIVQPEGGRDVARDVEFYNLDAIIAVGYRVNSYQATQFRVWATKTLREFIVKGFVLDDERLKQGKTLFGKDYFDELLERIREIRASERRFYQKITDIYALSIDYDPNAPLTREFFANVQNKLHWAITGQTAAEPSYSRTTERKPARRLFAPQPSFFGSITNSSCPSGYAYLSPLDPPTSTRRATSIALPRPPGKSSTRPLVSSERSGSWPTMRTRAARAPIRSASTMDALPPGASSGRSSMATSSPSSATTASAVWTARIRGLDRMRLGWALRRVAARPPRR